MEIEGRVAVVTGGRAIALALAAAGADVVASDVDEEGGMETVTQAEGRMSFVRADITVPDDVRRLITSAGPQILINNAGGGGHIPPHFPEATPKQWGATLELNLHGPMLATQLALEHTRRTGGGAVVNVASTAGLGFEPYPVARVRRRQGGLIRFTSALGGLEGGRVNCIVPDWVATERVSEAERGTTPPPIRLRTSSRRCSD